MLVSILLIPLVSAMAFALWRSPNERLARILGTLAAALPLGLLIVCWRRFDPNGPLFQQVVDWPWIPAVGAGFRLGLDGIALAVAATSALLFTVAIAYPVDHRGKARQYVAWMLFLEAVSLGLFLALDLLLFYVCFDLSLVGMYFLIALWGHKGRKHAALKFILYTLAGSLVMLLGFLSLALAADPLSFDMRALIEQQPLAGTGARASLTLLAILIGLAVKTPLVPLHTWLPAAHVEAPAPASTILAGVLLKMGTFGMIRIAYAMLSEPFREWALWLGSVAVVSIVYGSLVALGQRHLKRRIAYTSITHMGYTVLGIAVAAHAADNLAARRLALTGASLEMVAHGLITGALFLIAGSLWRRTKSFEMDRHRGVAARAPWLTAFAVVAAFASLGMPALAGFVAEFQIFSGAIAIQPWLAGIALVGVLVTAALFLQILQVVFLGKPNRRVSRITDIDNVEKTSLALLIGLTVVIGIAPAFVVDLIDAASRAYVGMP